MIIHTQIMIIIIIIHWMNRCCICVRMCWARFLTYWIFCVSMIKSFYSYLNLFFNFIRLILMRMISKFCPINFSGILCAYFFSFELIDTSFLQVFEIVFFSFDYRGRRQMSYTSPQEKKACEKKRSHCTKRFLSNNFFFFLSSMNYYVFKIEIKSPFFCIPDWINKTREE